MTWLHPTRKIDRALSGDLSSLEETRLRAHVRDCAPCRQRYDEGVALLRLVSRTNEAPGELRRLERRVFHELSETSSATGSLRRFVALDRRGVVLTAAVSVVVVLVASELWSRTRAVGVVLARSGEIWIDAEPAEPGDRIPPDVLVSTPKGDALILLEGERQVLLRQGAAVRVAPNGDIARLSYGRARFDVDSSNGPNPFSVLVEDVRVEVQGTVFAVEKQSEGGTLVAVQEGRVQVQGTKSEVAVVAGQETTVQDGAPAPPRPARDSSLSEDRGGLDILTWLRNEGTKVLEGVGRLFRRRR